MENTSVTNIKKGFNPNVGECIDSQKDIGNTLIILIGSTYFYIYFINKIIKIPVLLLFR